MSWSTRRRPAWSAATLLAGLVACVAAPQVMAPGQVGSCRLGGAVDSELARDYLVGRPLPKARAETRRQLVLSGRVPPRQTLAELSRQYSTDVATLPSWKPSPGRKADGQLTEVDETGSVPRLLLGNASDRQVRILDGEELVGAKQNRIVNTTILVAAGSALEIPVSCVEQGRWDYETEKSMRVPREAELFHAPAPWSTPTRSSRANWRTTSTHSSPRRTRWRCPSAALCVEAPLKQVPCRCS